MMIDVLFKTRFSLLERYLARRNFKRFTLGGKDSGNDTDSDSSSLSAPESPRSNCESDEAKQFERIKSKIKDRLVKSYTGNEECLPDLV